MEGLTKENFFNEAGDKYPLALHLFKAWIDEQKKQLDWDKLFAVKFTELEPVFQDHKHKFHDLPFELQFGILFKFLSIQNEPNGLYKELIINFHLADMKYRLTEMFKKIEAKIKAGKLDKK